MTTTTKAARAVGGLIGLLGIGLGARFLLDPAGAAVGYGVPSSADDPYLAVKGVRDLGTGVTVAAFLARRDDLGLGAALLALSTIPVGDALVAHRHGAAPSTSLGIHGATAAVMAAAGVVLARTARSYRP